METVCFAGFGGFDIGVLTLFFDGSSKGGRIISDSVVDGDITIEEGVVMTISSTLSLPPLGPLEVLVT